MNKSFSITPTSLHPEIENIINKHTLRNVILALQQAAGASRPPNLSSSGHKVHTENKRSLCLAP